jgi:hypothetical protein
MDVNPGARCPVSLFNDSPLRGESEMKSTLSLTSLFALVLAAGATAQIQDPDQAVRESVSRTRSDLRSMAVALESYFVDNNSYPAWVQGSDADSQVQGNSILASMPTFRRAVGSSPGGTGLPMTLTTPVAYLTAYMADPFNGQSPNTFSYFSDVRGWILLSPGPDGDFDVAPSVDYKSSMPQPSPELLLLAYDPTNGEVSGGDIYRVR